MAKTAGSRCTGKGDTLLATVLTTFPMALPRVAPT